VVSRRGGFDSSWVRVFVYVPITNDSEALLQARVLVLCGVGTRHYDVVVIFVAMDAGRDGVIWVFEDSLDDVDAFLVQKVPYGLDVVHTQSSLCGYSDDGSDVFVLPFPLLLLLVLMLARVRRRCTGYVKLL
jgi:hypothetical protein